MKMRNRFMNLVFTILLVKCPAEETKAAPVSGWIEDILSDSKNAKWNTSKLISTLKKLRSEVMLDGHPTFNSLN